MCLAGVSDKAAGVRSAWVGAGEAVLRKGEQIKMETAARRGL